MLSEESDVVMNFEIKLSKRIGFDAKITPTNNNKFKRFQILSVASMTMNVIWKFALCSLV